MGDEQESRRYRLEDQAGKEVDMSTTSEEIRIGQMAIRFLLEGEESGGSVAVFEFEVPAAGRVPAPTAMTLSTRRSTGSRGRSAGRSTGRGPTS
jgi:hypothetical protein